ncbi:molybdopterin biosynthesis protein [Eubacteriales bacterium OttesenSCG-928-M02]|nr:molybdopterin biosynthesis protein [Eubacteriales bacterium OttesenSCG-928-M02]
MNQYRYLTNIPLAEAREQFVEMIKSNCQSLGEEAVSIMEATGRVLSRPVYAAISAPHFHASAMDGIAMLAKDGFGATETTPVTLTDYVVVDTGDPIPKQYDCVVMVEDLLEEEDGIQIATAPVPWQNIRQIGEDICQGEMAFPSYTPMSPSAIGVLISCGITTVWVVKKAKVAIIPTGDEIVLPKADPKEGEILEFNSSIFSGMLREWGCEPVTYPIVKDTLSDITNAVKTASQECDFVLLNAGSSAGREDYASAAIANIGQVLIHGIAIRPGKPAILGRAGNVPVVGVPGYPVSGVIVMEELVRPALSAIAHLPVKTRVVQEAILTQRINSPLKYQEFIRVSLNRVKGSLMATPLSKGASVISSFAKADGLLVVDQNTEMLPEGQGVQVEVLRPMDQIENTIAVIGSHDPLFDEVSDMLNRSFPGVFLASTHVGSMGGINAIKRGQAHGAGIHLLDEATGEYNKSYLKTHFPSGGVVWMRGVGRLQGFMVQKGNPLGIGSVRDLTKDGLRYVNRQRGAGTRILLDYMLKNEGMEEAAIYGYEREEFTHLSVAAQIAADSADAGLGIYSAAASYGLDFVPVTTEQYDILLDEAFTKTAMFEAFQKVITGQAFIDRLTALGGYSFTDTGKILEYL